MSLLLPLLTLLSLQGETHPTPQVPDGFEVKLWASDPLLANPVVFYPDALGGVYVCESYRQETEGIPDNRAHQYWTEDDLRCMTVEDRAEMYLRHHPEYATEWTDKEDRIVLVEDQDEDGFADSSKVFADGFNDLLDGTGAGFLIRPRPGGGTNSWYTCIPHLWKILDEDGDGVSETRASLHRGYGVRVALRGHDMHGLQIGPDGRLYFSLGDRGYAVNNDNGELLTNPGSGAVFRCELDGSGLEIFCVGLRNPQELCFDDYGNLWTGDNNCDAGDSARIVYLTEGGDCGWRMNYQYLPDRGPWMPESWWKPAHQGQPAFLNAPIANLTSGPSGISYYPGTGLPESFSESFFIADFLGGKDWSGIRRFMVEPIGAGFQLSFDEEFIWKTLATDVDFMPNGSLMVSDWIEGWYGVGKGRLWEVQSTDEFARLEGKETAKILRKFWDSTQKQTPLPTSELVSLLSHPDRRVRMEAQFALAELERGDLLLQTFLQSKHQLARIHSVWGLSQIERKEQSGRVLPVLVPALNSDPDPEIRAQLAKAMGEQKVASAKKNLRNLLKDSSLRVRYFAALSLGKLGENDLSSKALLQLVTQNTTQDRFIRHAASIALSKTASDDFLKALSSHTESSVRMAAVLALRHQHSPALRAFLRDKDPLIATEAAIAIYDLPISDALGDLAESLNQDGLSDSHLRRAIHACYLSGRDSDAASLHRFVLASPAENKLREEALVILWSWHETSGFDRLHNTWRPELPREDVSWANNQDLPPLKEKGLAASQKGKKVFFENASASCQKCHWIQGESSGEAPSEVGPELSSIGFFLSKQELQNSIANPSAQIAPGFEIRDSSGSDLGISAMTPNLGEVLGETEVKNLVEYLDSLRRPKKVLVHVFSAGYEHAVARMTPGKLSLVERSWTSWAKENPWLEVVVDRSPEQFSKENLADFDAIFLYTTGELPWPEGGKLALLDFVQNGGALIGAHCASDTFYEWPEFGELLGGYFNGHPWHEEVGIKVEDPDHLSTQNLPTSFEIVDEIYQFKDWTREGKRVLLSLDTDSGDLTRPTIRREDGDFGITWTRRHGKGRIFYTALGHRPEVWKSTLFQEHLLGGTLWATRK